MIALAELIERFEPDLLQRYGPRLLPSQQQALAAMKRCRTRFAPRMLAQCTACGEQRSVPHSCGHRACPHCQHHDSEVWLQRQLRSLVPATYFLITFTLPSELRGLAWGHQRVVYAALMQCAWETLATFSRNDAKLGATPGAVGVLHTHNRRLELHPHVHMVMPAAVLDTRGAKLWRTKCRRATGKTKGGKAAGGYLFNHKALAKVFRAKVLDAIGHAGLVDCKAVGDGSQALLYLGRYLYRGVIQERDILRCDEAGNVTFQYRDAKTGKMAVRTLPGAEFLWLVLQHVLPKGLAPARATSASCIPTAPARCGCCSFCTCAPHPACQPCQRPAMPRRCRHGRPGVAPAANRCRWFADACLRCRPRPHHRSRNRHEPYNPHAIRRPTSQTRRKCTPSTEYTPAAASTRAEHRLAGRTRLTFARISGKPGADNLKLTRQRHPRNRRHLQRSSCNCYPRRYLQWRGNHPGALPRARPTNGSDRGFARSILNR